ncbi:MAG: hypothetical protein GY751_03555 [Bacteroidetes bacterium]|nr:hypothetical protein [Bacteroidota bacterium]
MVMITIEGWNPDFNKVQFNKLLREYAGYSLSDAKSKVDQVLDGHDLEVDISAGKTEAFRVRAEKLGAVLR